MALNIGESQAVMDLLKFLVGTGQAKTLDDRLKDSLVILHAGAYKTLNAGITRNELIPALFPGRGAPTDG